MNPKTKTWSIYLLLFAVFPAAAVYFISRWDTAQTLPLGTGVLIMLALTAYVAICSCIIYKVNGADEINSTVYSKKKPAVE